MEDPPLLQPTCASWVEFCRDGLNVLERVEEVDFRALKVALNAAEAQTVLLAGRLDVDKLPGKAARFHLYPRK